jgi:hypothetical protein
MAPQPAGEMQCAIGHRRQGLHLGQGFGRRLIGDHHR